MTEQTATAAPTTPTPVPPEKAAEVQALIAKEHAAIAKMNLEELVKYASEHNIINVDPTKVNLGWLQRKCSYGIRAILLAQHGMAESETIKKNREKVDTADPTKAPVGRKRMTTAGTYKLAIPEGGNEGRPNTAKGKIIASIKALETFTYENFKQAVSDALKWDEAKAGFDENTKFKTLDQATGAWWSELKNKAKIIVEVTIAA